MNTVYGAILSPFVRKVLMTLDYKQQLYEKINILPRLTPPEYARISPLRKVPAFKDDYVTLCDSSVICDYLENRYPQPSLYPKTPVDRARALWLEEFADTKLFEHLGPGLFFEKIVAPVMFRRASNDALIEQNIRALPPLLDYLEREVIPATGFLLGTELCIADLILPGVFLNASYANYQVDEKIWPRFAAYLKRSWAHPLYQARIAEEQQLLATMHARSKNK